MSKEEKSPYHHGNLRKAMLRAAATIITESGLSALTLRACARVAGVSHAAPAHHFGDLRGLLTALSTQSFKMLGDQTEALRIEHKDKPDKAFGALGRIYVQFAQQHPDRFRLMMRCDIVDYSDSRFKAAATRCFKSMTNIIALASGHAPVVLQELTGKGGDGQLARDVVMTWSLIHGFAHLRIEGNFDPFAPNIGGQKFDDLTWDDIGRRIGELILKPKTGSQPSSD
ncbi:TetR/AcrR family transcriptional regulator [Halovulum sp. GXIMD14793]